MKLGANSSIYGTLASKSPPFYIHEAQIRYSFWVESPRTGFCREYPSPGYVSRIFPPLNSNNSLNIHKETISYRTLILPIKVNQPPSYRISRISVKAKVLELRVSLFLLFASTCN